MTAKTATLPTTKKLDSKQAIKTLDCYFDDLDALSTKAAELGLLEPFTTLHSTLWTLSQTAKTYDLEDRKWYVRNCNFSLAAIVEFNKKDLHFTIICKFINSTIASICNV